MSCLEEESVGRWILTVTNTTLRVETFDRADTQRRRNCTVYIGKCRMQGRLYSNSYLFPSDPLCSPVLSLMMLVRALSKSTLI